MGLPSIVLIPFIGVHNLFSVDYYGWLVEALLECIFDQGPRCGMVPADPTVDITRQLVLLFDGDATM